MVAYRSPKPKVGVQIPPPLPNEETILDDLFVHSMDWRVLYKTIERKLRGELK